MASEGFTFALPSQQPGAKPSPPYPLPSSVGHASSLSRIKLSDIQPEYGAPSPNYMKSIEELSSCLSKYGAVILELSPEDAAFIRCGIESAKLYFRSRSSSSAPPARASGQNVAGYISRGSRELYHYREGRNSTGVDAENPPPCCSDIFRCLGKTSRIALAAICRQLQLRSDVFYPLLDDCPLPYEATSSSELLITHFCNANARGKASDIEEGNSQDFEKGFLMLVAADSPGLQVRDKNGLWYLADISLRKGEVLLITGKALQHVTAGLSYACSFREAPLTSSTVPGATKRVSLMFRLIPRGDAILDGTIMKNAGRAISGSFGPIQASKFLDNLNSEDTIAGTKTENNMGRKQHPTLKSLLSGVILDDAYTAAGCGHSFGGESLKTVKETKVCTSCGASVDVEAMIPNLVLRAVAKAFNKGERRRRLKIASRKRKRELLGRRNALKKLKTPKESSSVSQDGSEQGRAFHVNEKVLIKGNKRTPEKLVGREAFVTSKCLNGWYLVKLAHNGESVRLQYRSLQAIEEVKCESMQEEDSKPEVN